ncbi:hypothetical protein NL676_032104 [Syzygium grande]|nr:hypothetical protein NL676_032104 [Syzygium grande]
MCCPRIILEPWDSAPRELAHRRSRAPTMQARDSPPSTPREMQVWGGPGGGSPLGGAAAAIFRLADVGKRNDAPAPAPIRAADYWTRRDVASSRTRRAASVSGRTPTEYGETDHPPRPCSPVVPCGEGEAYRDVVARGAFLSTWYSRV